MSDLGKINPDHFLVTTALVRADAYVLADPRPLDDFQRDFSDVSQDLPPSAARPHSNKLGVRDAQRHREEPGAFADD